MLDFRKMGATLLVLSITAPTTTTLASAQEAALSEGERHGLAACLVKCPDNDTACVNRCMSKSQTRGVVWSDATRACIRSCRTGGSGLSGCRGGSAIIFSTRADRGCLVRWIGRSRLSHRRSTSRTCSGFSTITSATPSASSAKPNESQPKFLP
jgi:hypothetical protein